MQSGDGRNAGKDPQNPPAVSTAPVRRLVRWMRGLGRGAPSPVVTTPAPPVPPTSNDFENVKASWEALAEHDPLWAIVSTPGKEGNRWDLDEFFLTGVDEVRWVFHRLAERGIAVPGGRALDYGAGVGRLTQALATKFEHVDGVDIAAPMIERARALNRFGDRVAYHLGDGESLPFPDASFDFVFSKIVLQHVGIELQRRYVREFLRVVRTDGLVVFQAPSRALRDAGTHFQSPVATPGGTVTIDMNVFPRADVEATVRGAGGAMLHAIDDASAGDGFESYLYVATRPAG
jgi:SAM-dependent methyltransferase